MTRSSTATINLAPPSGPTSVVDAEDTLRAFARRCVLDVIDLWDAPDVVREYLETGDEDLRSAAEAATRAATWAAARNAAWDAARDATRAATQAATRAAAQAATRYAARYAAWDAAWDEKIEEYNGWLEEMLLNLEEREEIE